MRKPTTATPDEEKDLAQAVSFSEEQKPKEEGKAPPVLSIFDDERAVFGEEYSPRKTYNAQVQLGSTEFFVATAPKEVLAEHDRKIQAAARGMIHDETARQGAADYVAANEYLIERTVIDWHDKSWPRPVPCTKENLLKMSPAAKAELAMLILARSGPGVIAADFASGS